MKNKEVDQELAPPVIQMNVDWGKKQEARQKAVDALAELVPVFNVFASFAPPEAYRCAEDEKGNDYWDMMRMSVEYSRVQEALCDYIRYEMANPRNEKTISFIAKKTGTDKLELYNSLVEKVLRKLPATMATVSGTYHAKKGIVGKAEGCLLYMASIIFSSLIDTARKIDSKYGRNEKKQDVELFESEGRIIASADVLTMGQSVIRRGNRVGSFAGEQFVNGIRYALFQFQDSCLESVPWDLVSERVRIFTGNLQTITECKREEQQKKDTHYLLSLDAVVGEDEDSEIALINLIEGHKAAEEVVLDNHLREIVRKTYLETLYSLRHDFAMYLMLAVYVHDKLCLELTHMDTLQDQLKTQDAADVFGDLHFCNCAIMSMDGEAERLISLCPAPRPCTTKELTDAKHHAKKLLRRNMSLAMAA